MLFVSKIYAGSVGLDTGPDKLAPATGMPFVGVLTEDLHPDAMIAFLSEARGLELGTQRVRVLPAVFRDSKDERRGRTPAHVQMWSSRPTPPHRLRHWRTRLWLGARQRRWRG